MPPHKTGGRNWIKRQKETSLRPDVTTVSVGDVFVMMKPGSLGKGGMIILVKQNNHSEVWP